MSSTLIIGWFIAELGSLSLAAGAKALEKKLKDKKAQRELAEACAAAVEAAADSAPSLREDIVSKTFVEGVAVPTVQALLMDPSQLAEEDALSSAFIDIFVKQFVTGESTIDDTFERIFQADRMVLKEAFTEFFRSLKQGLYQSDHWRDLQQARASEETLALLQGLSDQLTMSAGKRSAAAIPPDEARSSAAEASSGLRSWQSEIEGTHIVNPAREKLLERIRSDPNGITLLVGEAGTGKSALLATLFDQLETQGILLFGIKADQIPASVSNMNDISKALGIEDRPEDCILALAAQAPVVLLVDQLDAVSAIMDHQTQRMNLLLRLIIKVRAWAAKDEKRVHVVVSSRPFEARHDPRFGQLKAETVELDFLPQEAVDEFLEAINVPVAELSNELRKSLCRPFALRLFTDLALRGETIKELTGSELLERWLATAKLGEGEEARETIRFLETLAKDMVGTESLWRPADRFDLDFRDAVRRAEACGLIVRRGDRLGFSHQAWLDDFQAKTFRTGQDLAEFTLEKQDSLFVRTTVLRALQRMRTVDRAAYERACNALLANAKTRRHIRHLLAEVFGSASDPDSIEIGWIPKWVREDPSLAARALGQVAGNWGAWRESLNSLLPDIMSCPMLEWHAVILLSAEAEMDSANTAFLVLKHWQEEKFDLRAIDVIQRSGELSHGLEKRALLSIERSIVDPFVIGQLLEKLHERDNHEMAASFLVAWARSLPSLERDRGAIFDLETIVEEAPIAYLTSLLPWFLEVLDQGLSDGDEAGNTFRRSRGLPFDWAYLDRGGNLFGALRAALRKAMVEDPQEAWKILQAAVKTDIDQAQELVAEGLMAAGEKMAAETANFLLDDPRRLCISEVHVDGIDNIGRTIHGWHSRQLAKVVGDCCDNETVEMLRDAIEAYNRFDGKELKKSGIEYARKALSWNEDTRLGLLSGLSGRTLTKIRKRQVEDWLKQQTPIKGEPNTIGMANSVGSPMSVDAMSKASNDAIQGMLDKLDDNSRDESEQRLWRGTGGVSELAWAFGEFAKKHPDRAISLATSKLKQGRHEIVAGRMVGALSENDQVDPKRILDIVLEFSERGFTHPQWRSGAAHALRNIASRSLGLPNQALTLVESWIEDNPEVIVRQVAERLQAEKWEAERKVQIGSAEKEKCEPFLFGHRDSISSLPSGNFTFLSTLFAGIANRAEPDWNLWLGILERHLRRAEDPQIWSAVLAHHGRALRHCDRENVNQLIAALLEKHKAAFEVAGLAPLLWTLRFTLDRELLIELLEGWLASEDLELKQAAAEFVCGAILVDPDQSDVQKVFAAIAEPDEAVERGALLTAGTAWNERNKDIRARAHALLLDAISEANENAAAAIARMFHRRRSLRSDQVTAELLRAVGQNPKVLRASLGYSLYRALEGLLLFPDWSEIVIELCERAFDALAEEVANQQLGHSATELVGLSIALQRVEGDIRSRAMDLYEKLLDARVYRAEQAARDATRA
ncbi:AAA family ATPase [Qipengyuania aquimaris]|uniref:AAA family ATPase n=1 Tax=Qipengyuania aquimaris TaxID=255984 RepID=UPI001FD2FCE7|nr:ATP-binding protein [Qipengyuania aquimaris]UOR15826.1 ATP-binding protein [Qipengyuania aquimaris]